ncbi:MAG: S1C family serine protease [Burkholderiales bacterium]
MIRRLLVFVTFVSIGLAAGLVLTGRMRMADITSAEPPRAQAQAPAAQPSRAPAPNVSGLPDLTAIAQRAIDSVTNISSTQVVRSRMTDDPFFRFFFQDDLFRERRQQSLGSGVVVSPDGYVLTNNHVVGSAGADVRVGLADKREVRAKVIGTDEWTDIAVLKLDLKNLPTLPWGDSSKIRVAEWVLAIGNPFQLNQTVTLGIVSATNRRLEGRGGQYEDFIQTDAAINPGNSGGALINARGELVGINTAIYSESGGYQGIGFAVPSNLARHVMDEIIKYGSVRRGTIRGIQLQVMTPQIAAELGAPDARGVLVLGIDPRSDVYAAGMRQYDIIVGFNGADVEDGSHFLTVLSEAEIGSSATLTVLRRGDRRTVRVKIEQAGGRSRV